MTRYFIRKPRPGQDRGEGAWVKIGMGESLLWADYKASGYLPTGRTCAARDENDRENRVPIITVGQELIHQFAGFAVTLTDFPFSSARDQLNSLIEQKGACQFIEQSVVRHYIIWESARGSRVVVLDTARWKHHDSWMIVYAGLSLEDRIMRPHGCQCEDEFLRKYKPTGDFRTKTGRIVADFKFKEEVA